MLRAATRADPHFQSLHCELLSILAALVPGADRGSVESAELCAGQSPAHGSGLALTASVQRSCMAIRVRVAVVSIIRRRVDIDPGFRRTVVKSKL